LWAIGSPASGGLAFLRSMAFPAFSACSGRKVTMALTLGLTRSICATKACMTSVTESFRA
jgi:hypothetical protein